MNTIQNKEKLNKTILEHRRITYLFGAGFSMALGEHSYSWKNWLKKGLDFLNPIQKEKIISLIASSDNESLIKAADVLINELYSLGKYTEFMNSTIEIITPTQKELIESLKLITRNGDFIATTNYDLIIEKATNLKTVTYNNAGNILKILKEESENKILHLHGAYSLEQQVNDIIATPDQYDKIVASQGAQFVQNLLSTNPIIIVGCGSTIEDPNLKNFLQFSTEYLNLDIPYFYLHCKKDSLEGLPDKIIPICYGDDYTDLPSFLLYITMTRIRENPNIKDICRVNPYTKIQQNNSAYSRMHYVAKYIDFIGRKDELLKLNNFIHANKNFAWWMITGEAGIGKSRLLLEWLYNLPPNWFGFFANLNSSNIEKYISFKPFSNTIVVLDYVAGQENICASIIKILVEIFKNSPYYIRIVLTERHYEPNKKDWFYKLMQCLNPSERIFFEKAAYSEQSIQPLNVSKLKHQEEKNYIKNYLKKYVPELNNEILNKKYLADISNTVEKIHCAYRKMLRGLFHRPLYLSIFIEVWVDKVGDFKIKNSEELLECYLQKEEKRWLERFNSNRPLLNTYLKLLALACAIGIFCINEENSFYQKPSDIFYEFLLSEEQAGIRKTSWTDLFTYTEANEDNPLEPWYIIEPLYPDIIKEFIVLQYVSKEECGIFAKTARYVSVIQLSMFLMHALEDFPNNEKFIEMVVTEPSEDREHFDYFLGLISTIFNLPNHDRIINQLSKTSQQVTKDFGIYELFTWNQLANAQLDKLYKNEIKIQDYYEKAKKFISIVDKKFNLKVFKENSLEVIDIWFEGLHNTLSIEYAEEFLILINNLINKLPRKTNIHAITATKYAEYYQKMLILHARKNNYNACKKDISCIEKFLKIYPKDEDIINSYVKTLTDYATLISTRAEEKLINEFIPLLKSAYEKYKHIELIEKLALLYTNAYLIHLNNLANTEAIINYNDNILNENQKLLLEIKQAHPENRTIIGCYLSIESILLITKFTKKENIVVPKAIMESACKYKKQWSNDLEIVESFARLLYLEICILNKNSVNKKTINKKIKELSTLANESEHLYKEYNSINQIKLFAQALKQVNRYKINL